MLNRFIKSSSVFDFRLYIVLILSLMVPTIYKTLRIYLLGDLPTDTGYNIASQIIWLNVIFEVFQEGLLLPLFFLLGQSVNNRSQFDNKIKTGFIVTGIVYFLPISIILLFSEPLLVLMAQKQSIIKLSSQYIKLESISVFFTIIYRFTIIILMLFNKSKTILGLLIIQTIAICICDIFLLGQFSFSLNYGVLGIGYGNIIVGFMLLILCLVILIKEDFLLLNRKSLDFSWLKDWFRIGGISGIESFIRNGIFILVILRLINKVEGQSFFWISNSFIWGWLLIPIIALGEIIKKETGANKIELQKIISASLIITTIIASLWLITIPLWRPFFKLIMNVDNTKIIFDITWLSILFYIAYAYNNIIDSVFYGYGRTDLMLIQSIIINIIYYGIIGIAVRFDILEITLYSIVIIFGAGILLDSVVTFGLFKYYLHRNKLPSNGKPS